jgi:hypothetical protein
MENGVGASLLPRWPKGRGASGNDGVTIASKELDAIVKVR